MFCLLRWWKAPFGVCLESLKLQYSTQNTSICIQEKNAVCALFSEVRCANKPDRHKDKSNTCEYTGAKENAMFIVALFSNKRTQKLFSAFFSMWEISLRSRRRLEGHATLSLTSRRCFFGFPPVFSFPVSFAPSTRIAHPVRCFLLSVNKSQSDCFSDHCWAQPVDQAVVSLPRNIVPEWIRTLFSLCYNFVINVYIFLIFWHHMNKDMYECVYIHDIYIYTWRLFWKYLCLTSFLGGEHKWHYVVEAKKTAKDKKN